MFLLIIALQISALGDGVFVPPRAVHDARIHAADITEPTQKACLAWSDGQERLVLQVSFKGEAERFAWLVPTPSVPKVSKADDSIFHTLHLETAPKYKYWFDADKRLSELSYTKGREGAMRARPAVDVIERKQVGVYDVAVLRSGDTRSLLDWLRQNGFYVSDKLSSVVSDYIRRGWVFTAMRIDPKQKSGVSERLKQGVLQSIDFQFSTAKPIYPLKVSSANAGSTDVLIYTIAEHQLTEPMLHTVCCISDVSHVSPRRSSLTLLEMWKMGYGKWEGNGWLTKFSATLSPAQMDRDLVFTPAKKNVWLEPDPIAPPFLDNFGKLALFCFTSFLFIPYSFIPLALSILIYRSRFGRAHRAMGCIVLSFTIISIAPGFLMFRWSLLEPIQFVAAIFSLALLGAFTGLELFRAVRSLFEKK